jgi:hypothetical protein
LDVVTVEWQAINYNKLEIISEEAVQNYFKAHDPNIRSEGITETSHKFNRCHITRSTV